LEILLDNWTKCAATNASFQLLDVASEEWIGKILVDLRDLHSSFALLPGFLVDICRYLQRIANMRKSFHRHSSSVNDRRLRGLSSISNADVAIAGDSENEDGCPTLARSSMDDHVPFPRLCGATFQPTGRLVHFNSRSTVNELNVGDFLPLPRTYDGFIMYKAALNGSDWNYEPNENHEDVNQEVYV
jgi:hypothetical protein